jgi:hypothetical protein
MEEELEEGTRRFKICRSIAGPLGAAFRWEGGTTSPPLSALSALHPEGSAAPSSGE